MNDIQTFVRESLGMEITHDQMIIDFKKEVFKANHILTDYGDVEWRMMFLNKGLVEMSVLSERNEEKVIEFITPDSFFNSYESFLKNTPSSVRLRAITSCEIEYALKSHVKSALEHDLITNIIARKIIDGRYVKRMESQVAFLTKSAKERYEELVAHRPEIIQQVSVKKIAQYLGIHKESLSRIRHSFAH